MNLPQPQTETVTVNVPCAFIDRHMTEAAPVYALVYLFCLRRSADGVADVSAREIGHVFRLLPSEVDSALRYWENARLFSVSRRADGLRIAFLPEPSAPAPTAPVPLQVLTGAARTDEPAPGGRASVSAATASSVWSASIPSGPGTDRPQYTVEELTVYRAQSKEIESLFALGEQTLGKMLTFHDMNLLFGFYDWLRLPVDVIGYLLAYCADHDHRDMRYIEKCALDWADHGLDDLEKALAYVQTFDRDYRAILRAMGADTAYPTPSQRKHIKRWLDEYRQPCDLILHAIDTAAERIGKPKFAYVDKMLLAWRDKGIRTVAAARVEAEAYVKDSAAGAVKHPEPKTARVNRFVNFKQRERDYGELERLEREYLTRSLKE